MSLPFLFKYPSFTTHGLTFPFTRRATHTIDGSTRTPLLDLPGVPAAQMAFGLRKLRGAYTGCALDLRRTVGGVTVEVYVFFNPDGRVGLDSRVEAKSGTYTGINTLGEFCKSTDGFVTKFYDQSGNGKTLTQTTAANQPKLVSNGFLLEGVAFDASASYMVSNYEHEVSTDDFTYLAVSKYHASASSGTAYGLMNDLNNYNKGVEVHVLGDVYRFHLNQDANDMVTTIEARTTTKDLVIASYDPAASSNEQRIRINESVTQQDCTTNLIDGWREVFAVVGRRIPTAVQGFWYGDINEVITWETALTTAQAEAVEEDIMDFHGIA